jgi:hypothetical protein
MAKMSHANSMFQWKKNLVLVAKNTYVWLHQLSQKYGRSITLLDQIPIEELESLKNFGINGIWLIGIWERSQASRKIKTLYGYENAAASAYSIISYTIAESLGGRKSFLKFRDNAHSVGLKIGCDMVPNHTGLDSPWLVHHPDWYIQADKNPSQDFVFNSPDLSPDDSVQIRIEEGYYDQTGAAEVFSYKNMETGIERFIYHGNDGTSMPWNDTAQLNYLVPEVREAVRETILNVADDFDIIRLDAAMTLTRQHFKRLWFPGDDGQRCIPTRENDHMTDAQFDNKMPQEFWAQVIQDIQQHQPDTLLMAEAFWLMESYFIEQIGMDRVYNSAFMNMMKQEENQQFRAFLRTMSDTQSNALEHLVNYQTTPDEDPAILLFGRGDKYFGVCTLLCTLPGLPMFGHGQIEGFSEKYGMDFLMPYLDESADDNLYNQHQRLITPILKRRELFAFSENFVLHDFKDFNGNDIEDVIIFSNAYHHRSALVLFNNSANPQQGILKLPADIVITQKNLISLSGSSNEPINYKIDLDLQRITLELRPYASDVFLFENTRIF